MGMAKPSPIEPPSPPCWPMLRMAVLMPMTAPVASTSAPPELPGLIAASVWMASMTATVSPLPSSRTGRGRNPASAPICQNGTAARAGRLASGSVTTLRIRKRALHALSRRKR